MYKMNIKHKKTFCSLLMILYGSTTRYVSESHVESFMYNDFRHYDYLEGNENTRPTERP